MPCSDPNHNKDGINTHYWPPEGSLRIWPCERECGFCSYRARDSSNLRSHVRDIHMGKDYPDVTVQVGQRRPPLFDTAIHGTAHLRAHYEGSAAHKKEKKAAQASAGADHEEAKSSVAGQSDSVFHPESVQSNEASEGITSGGPTAAVKNRPRNIQVTEKAAAAAADGHGRKRKRTAAGKPKPHPQESNPSHSSTKATKHRKLSYFEDSFGSNGAGAEPGQGATRENTVTNGHENPKDKLYTNITNNIAGLLDFADASKLDKIRVYDAANEALKKWLLSHSSSKDL
ncbi:hypothetical protein HDK77DRAFT_441955 [Phyllosticta capitalensis]|uniref:C2H2-type domain-containing protein n=1 Tax=Phyllosticta capitalensis TaxID=121624 RepID=A0ABR1Z4F2_9PEZI